VQKYGDRAAEGADQAVSVARSRAAASAHEAEAAGDRLRREASGIASAGEAQLERAGAAARRGLDDAATATGRAWTATQDEARAAAQGLEREAVEAAGRAPGTVDAIRKSIRQGVSRGIERGREMVGLAHDTIESAKDNVQQVAAPRWPGESAEEHVLRQRYERKDVMAQSVDEALAERYRPITQRDNSVLRGI
jgi:altered-inheritance-of-mitochondria protein 5